MLSITENIMLCDYVVIVHLFTSYPWYSHYLTLICKVYIMCAITYTSPNLAAVMILSLGNIGSTASLGRKRHLGRRRPTPTHIEDLTGLREAIVTLWSCVFEIYLDKLLKHNITLSKEDKRLCGIFLNVDSAILIYPRFNKTP